VEEKMTELPNFKVDFPSIANDDDDFHKEVLAKTVAHSIPEIQKDVSTLLSDSDNSFNDNNGSFSVTANNSNYTWIEAPFYAYVGYAYVGWQSIRPAQVISTVTSV
jgi:hypothetical protein